MSNQAEEKSGAEAIELREKQQIMENMDEVSSNGDEAILQRKDTGMNRAKWLACISLCLAYTTAYQQSACTSAILKHIDEKLGRYRYQVTMTDLLIFPRANDLLQLDAYSIHHSSHCRAPDLWWNV